ncbi:DUF2975 domain-containing protein [Clostridium magnum]|uniref:DUF2975 domain-containing protein n=1 Tax=Clostridium magnum DSM 2767 TaxID=1121326 RepID=A0A162RIA9_9CLOT|nr:DUF2975 domain-containing protein [Clostridium magnum]KZL89943.1 hypothetical protein CLMAG_44270 [Clostridium magnum DSM 2767]SHJ33474.1 Protein of unknown function [Clostridium magnum DSM 2767]
MINKLEQTKSSLKTFLNIIYYAGLVGLIFSICTYFAFPSFISVKPSALMLVFSVGAYCCVLAIVHQLIKINDTVICKTPFIIGNVKRMKKIAAYLFIISAYVFIKDWLRFKAHIFSYTFDSSGLNTDAECLIFVLLGLFVLIVAKIFKTSIEIKNENDLTI